MPALIGGFFRRGRSMFVSHSFGMQTPVNPIVAYDKESRLSTAVSSNEVMLESCIKWGKISSRPEWLNTLPSLVILISWRQLNFRYKYGSAKINLLLRLKITYIRIDSPESVYLWIYLSDYTITENNFLEWSKQNDAERNIL